jgi:hypothetical protein
LRSIRPGRSNAGSKISIRFVAMSTCTIHLALSSSVPSDSLKRVHGVLQLSIGALHLFLRGFDFTEVCTDYL